MLNRTYTRIDSIYVVRFTVVREEVGEEKGLNKTLFLPMTGF